MDKKTEQLLVENKLKRTKLRLALLGLFIQSTKAQSYSDLKKQLGKTVDKSTLYRNLAAFQKVDLIHSITDDSGINKYAFGPSPGNGKEHPHFVCERCKTVYCMEEISQDAIPMPQGFQLKKVHTIVKGVCADC